MNLEIDVNEDGTIEPRTELEIETYYKPCESIYIDHENEFLAVIMDDGPGMAETRVMFKTLLDAGFVIPSKQTEEELHAGEGGGR